MMDILGLIFLFFVICGVAYLAWELLLVVIGFAVIVFVIKILLMLLV